MRDLMKGMILAAGFGTRMLPLTRRIPKALLPIGGRALLEWNLDYLAGQGVEEIVVNAHHLAPVMREWIEARAKARPSERIHLAVEEEILGTAGGIAHAARWLDSEPVVIMNVDMIFRPDLRAVVEQHRSRRSLATLVCVRDPLHAQIRIEEQRVAEIVTSPLFGDPDLWAFTGVYLLAREAVGRLVERSFRDGRFVFHEIVPEFRLWAGEGRLGAFTVEDTPFLEAGNAESYLDLVREIEGDGFRTVSPGARVARDCTIEESVILDGAEVEAGASVRRSVIGPGFRARGEVDRVVAAEGESRPLTLLSQEEERELAAFLGQAAFAGSPPGRSRFRRLQGDGSARQIIRAIQGPDSRIIVRGSRPSANEILIYPRRGGPGAPDETSSYLYIGGYLRSLGVNVPRIDAADPARGLLLMEDLGETLLYDLLRRPAADPQARDRMVRSLYSDAIGICRTMQSKGAEPFEPLRTHNVPYDEAFILEYESGYFHREMVEGFCGLREPGLRAAVRPEYERAAREAVEGAPYGFMHRDLQSRNLMMTVRGMVVIDFQGARLGPPEYDVASLLLDPYADLPRQLREELLEEWLQGVALDGSTREQRESALRRFRASGINRTLQALGAYAYLGGRRGKPGFLEHSPVAVKHLRELAGGDYPQIGELAGRIEAKLAG